MYNLNTIIVFITSKLFDKYEEIKITRAPSIMYIWWSEITSFFLDMQQEHKKWALPASLLLSEKSGAF